MELARLSVFSHLRRRLPMNGGGPLCIGKVTSRAQRYTVCTYSILAKSTMPNEFSSLQNDLDKASHGMSALCELLEAASDNRVRASSIHEFVAPLARKLAKAADGLSDCAYSHGKKQP